MDPPGMPAKGSGPEMLGPPSPQQPCRCRARALRPRAAPCPWSHVARRARAKRHARRAPGAAVHAAVSGEGRCVSGAGRRAAEAGDACHGSWSLKAWGMPARRSYSYWIIFCVNRDCPRTCCVSTACRARAGGGGGVRRRGEPRLERGVATRGVEVSLGPVVLGHKDRRDNVRVGPEEVSPRPRSVGRGGATPWGRARCAGARSGARAALLAGPRGARAAPGEGLTR